jgi:hypothetical protein
VEYSKYLDSLITNDARCTHGIKYRTAMARVALNKNRLFTSKLDLNVMKKLVKCYIWGMALYGAEPWTLWRVDLQYLESFEMWCWRRMDISWTDHVKNDKVLQRVEERNVIQAVRRKG